MPPPSFIACALEFLYEGIEVPTCDICCRPINEISNEYNNDPKQTKKCTHIFHSHCLSEWVLSGNRTCPTCNSVLFIADVAHSVASEVMDEVRNSAREEISRGRMDELTRCVHKETQFIFTELGSVPARSMATYIMDEVRGSQARYVPKPLLMVLHRCLRNGARNALVSLQYSLSGWVPRSDGDDSDNEPAAEGVSQSDESDDPDEFAGSSDQETSDIDGTEKTFYTPLTTKK